MPDTPPLYHQLAEQLHALIRAGTLRAGERVPSVRRLARQQGVSISTVLQAYARLEASGAIEARPQSGYYVRATRGVLPEPQAEPALPPVRAHSLETSALADAVRIADANPAFLSLAGSQPAAAVFALDRVARALAASARADPGTLGRAREPAGTERLRRAVARRALDWGCRLDHRNLVITTGGTEAVQLALRAVTRPGDMVAVEAPGAERLLQALESLGLRALEIPAHPRSGLALEALELALSEYDVRAVLAMPSVSDPLGATMPDAGKRALVEMLAARSIALIEYNPSGDLAFGASPPRAAKGFDRTEGVLLCGDFSTTLAPGLGVGWIAPGRWGARVRTLKAAAGNGPDAHVESAVAELLLTRARDRELRALRLRFEAEVDAARALIAGSFPPGTRVTRPEGGFLLWVELPEPCDTVELFRRLLAQGIVIAPGPLFSAARRFRNCLRLSVGDLGAPRWRRALTEVGTVARRLLRPM